ncbi:MAG: hypothetical protein LBI26_01760 [Holosporales bacterium]|jgi:hypothetical protein|nr:hypothetical protein [Holosporales bacterium]
MKNYWSHKDLEKLGNEYIAGKKIKIIAAELGRSYSATNKAISKVFGIERTQKGIAKSRTKIAYDNKQSKKYARDAREEKNHTVKNVDFTVIKKYLTSKGYKVHKFSGPSHNFYLNEIEIFTVQNKPMTKLNVLLLANKIRIEEQLPIFSSGEITWF